MFWKKKEKIPQKNYSYDINVQSDVTAFEAATIAIKGLRFRSHLDRNTFFDTLPLDCQRHIKRTEN